MKLARKRMILFIAAIVTMLLALLSGSVQAASQDMGLEEYRKARSDGAQYGYKVSDKYVWKIVTYNGSSINYNKTLYCLKAEQGFFTATPGVFRETYDLSYDFMNKSSMSSLPVPSQYYDAIVWILNHAYIPSASTASTDRSTLLTNAGISSNNELTDDDIDVVQQLAIWYFTNYNDSTYHKDMAGLPSFQTVLESKKTSAGKGEYQEIEDKNRTRYDQMDDLFVYLVTNAQKATSSTNNNSAPLAMDAATPSVTVNGSNYVVGPFKVNKSNDTPYTVSFSVTNQSETNLSGKYTILDSNKNATSKTLEQLVGSTFYLRIPISTVNSENITSLKISMNGSYTTTSATYWTKAGNSTVQPIVEINRAPKSFSGSKQVTFPTAGQYNLKLVKVEQGNTSKKLQGAIFKITSPNGTTTQTTNSSGEINIGTIKVNEPGTDTITIEETQAPSGYEKVINSAININVTKVLSGNQYSASAAQITNPQTGASLSASGNTITVTVENKLIPKNSEYNLKLIKVDSANTAKKLQGAQFKIISPNGTTTQTTNSSGEINVGPITVNNTSTDTITIEETNPPSGYSKIISSPITVQVTKKFENNTYSISGATITNQQTGASINLSGNTITVTVQNKEIPKNTNYNLKLVKVEQGNTSNKLSGAQFKITTPTGTVNQTTNSSGEINIGSIPVTSAGTDTITIEETNPPSGYSKIISSPITVQVTKKFENNTYSISGATITNQQTGASINVSGNTITVTVENKIIPKTSEYNLKLVKVEQGNTSKKLQGAEFKITSPNGEVTQTTDSNGEINIGPIAVNAEGTDTITIEETKAPAGYAKIIANPIQVQVTKTLVTSNNTYTMTDAKIINAQNGSSISLSGNTITVTVENKAKNFDLALRKYITKVNDAAVPDSRVPNIDTSTLTSGTTATYKHKKDPVKVRKGDKVTYCITIYNEGEKAGRATKIEDQLPTGLVFDKVLSGNFELDSYNQNDNLLKLKRTSNTDNLDAYNGNTLDSETIELQCTVTGYATSTNTVLTNVAWISEEYDAELNQTITNQQGADRDSEPSTKPDVNKDNMQNYNGNNNKQDLTDKNYYYKGQQDDDDFEKLIIQPENGNYELNLIKQDSKDGKALKGAIFKITTVGGETTQTTDENGKIAIGNLPITSAGTDTITIEETQAPSGYKKIINAPITISVTKELVNGTYTVTKAEITNPQTGASVSLSGKTITVTVQNEMRDFDLALRKYITKVNGVALTDTRVPNIDTSTLNGGTTATYKHKKDPVVVKAGDIVTYNITIYNEGENAGRATKIQDQLPTGLVFNKVVSGNFELDSYNQTDNLLKLKRVASNTDNLDAYNGTTLDSETIEIECTVTAFQTEKEEILTNVAWISEEYDSDLDRTITNTPGEDRDSEPDTHPDVNKDNMEDYNGNDNKDDLTDKDYYYKGQQDDDDFEKLKVVYFDLSLRKFITGKNDEEITGREPQVDVTHLADHTDTTAIYNHTKVPVDMQRGDVVIYTIRVYNEGLIDGYANEVTDYLPEELEFLPDNEINQEYEWKVSEDGRTVKTNYLSKEKETEERQNLIKAFDGTTLSYKDIKIACRIKDTAEFNKKLTNLAEITEDKDEDGEDVDDRDSTPDNEEVPPDEDLPNYKDDESYQDYVPGQEDDDDFEKVRVVYFDLALRKFITAVDDQEITNRIPQLSIGEDGNIHYDHTKDPVEVENGDIVTYTLRIFNEGLMDGYASLIKDDVPDGLQFLPDNETNKEYRWVVSEDGKTITTDYLSKEQEKEEGANLIKAFNPELGITDTNPDYRDVKIAFLVTEPNTSDRILVNTAEIADDRDKDNKPVEDIDSTPNNDNDWNEEDDLDKEFVKVKYFDLSLKKWVSKAIITNEDGSVTVQETGHTGDENPEPPAKVDLGRQDINKVTVKFEFQIKVTNEGEIAGYAKEVTDYIPEGLRFIQEDNPEWYPRDSLNGQERVGTRQLENTLLQPGESATVSIILTWINGQDNMGLKTNVAEISEDYNDSHTPDIDSTPDNDVPGEDDIDDAPVMLTIRLGETVMYIGLGFLIVAMLTSGVWAIKRFVL